MKGKKRLAIRKNEQVRDLVSLCLCYSGEKTQ
jgi:hypothetical protein